MARKKKDLELLEDLKKMSWKDYIKSRYWKNFRKQFDTDDATCEICGREKWSFYKVGKRKGKRKKKANCQFQVHHKRYILGEETKEDVMLLCRLCHEFFHLADTMSKTKGGVFTKIYEELKKETGWEYTPFKHKR